MKQGHKTWMAAVAFALCANAAGAAQMPDDNAAPGGPDASALMAFYGVSLATTPAGAVEDKAVWMAKVQGLIAQAPAWLQQNVLASKTKAEFAANLAILESMQKGTLESAASAVKAVAASSAKVSAKGVGPDNLGDSNQLVYTALEPCRIMDTRNASFASGVQGPILGNVLKQVPGYITAGLNWGQYGGNATTDCGLNSTTGGAIYAVAIVITILNPNFSAFLGVSDSSTLSTVLSTVALNYTGGQGLSTVYIVPQYSNTIYFAMPTGLSANIIFDVVGYFARSQATALDCVYPNAAATGSIPNGQLIGIILPSCAAGYTSTGAACYQDNVFGSVPLVEVSVKNYNDCIWVNNSGSAATGSNFHGERACCRVPGR
jgi:hypothetical protein